MQRLGKNLGRYYGEGLEIERVLREIHSLATGAGWEWETFYDSPAGTLRGYHRPAADPRRNLYISSGIHGDEPSGPLALLQLFRENLWPQHTNLWVSPCLNPSGFRRNTRENEDGIDLNRDYRSLETPVVRAHIAWLLKQPRFDLTLLLHEDWEATGFYTYELNPEKRFSFAEPVVEAIRAICPIEPGPLVDNFECRDGIIRPIFNPEDRPQWAEALWLIVNKASQSYTLETPSDFPLSFRVQTHVTALRRIFGLL